MNNRDKMKIEKIPRITRDYYGQLYTNKLDIMKVWINF